MRRLVLVLVIVGVIVGLGAAASAAQYRNPVFLTCGAPASTTTLRYASGLWLVDAASQRCTSLFPAWMRASRIHDAQMDADNRRIVFATHPTTLTTFNVANGIFRFDPASGQLQTLVVLNYGQKGPINYVHRMTINQDGDYVFGANGPSTTSSVAAYDYHFLKYDASNTLTTLFRYQMLGPNEFAYLNGAIGRDIDTGDYLTNANSTGWPTKLGGAAWIRIDPHVRGKWSTFAGGVNPLYHGRLVFFGNLHQDHATGDVQEVWRDRVYCSAQGGAGYSTLWVWGRTGGFIYSYPGCCDLQSAPTRRWVSPGLVQKQVSPTWSSAKPWVMLMHEKPYREFPVDCDPLGKLDALLDGPTTSHWVWDFYRNRNIQTVKKAANRWQVSLSCPDYPRHAYVAAVGASGIRPGVRLPDGRRIWLNVDNLVALSVTGRLRPFWHGGPGVLDANGEATGHLDTSAIAPLGGITVWIALLVLDHRAPGGVAFIPDTYVMKLP